MALLEFENVNFMYSITDDKYSLKNISFKINEGEFIVLTGASGSGKSTLLKLIKKEISPIGKFEGNIFFEGENINSLSLRESTKQIGYVMQNPENAIVTDKVWHELAFSLENLGYQPNEIKKRVYEVANYFGLEELFNKETDKLSGGEKQLVNLTSIMILNPKLLLLDEATSQLDPMAANKFLDIIKRISKEFGTTIIIVEHRLDEIMDFCDKIIFLDEGKVIYNDQPNKIGKMIDVNKNILSSLPISVRLFKYFNKDSEINCPLSINQGRKFIKENFNTTIINIEKKAEKKSDCLLELRNINFKYSKNDKNIIEELNIKFNEGKIYSIVGGNGTGKTTILKIIAGLLKPYTGKVLIKNKNIAEIKNLYVNNIGYLPQNPQNLFMNLSVYEELNDICMNIGLTKEEAKTEITKIASILNIEDYYKVNPYDLSGGEQQKVAISKILLLKPKILLLDEPTKGLDSISKNELIKILLKLREEGKTIIIVTHDLDFVGEVADYCTMLFNGELTKCSTVDDFFNDNQIYITSASRLTKNIFVKCTTLNDVIKICELNGHRL